MTIEEQFKLASEYLRDTEIECHVDGSELRFTDKVEIDENDRRVSALLSVIIAAVAILLMLISGISIVNTWSFISIIFLLCALSLIYCFRMPLGRKTYLIYNVHSNAVVIEVESLFRWNRFRDPRIWSAYTRDQNGVKLPFVGGRRSSPPKGLLLSRSIPMDRIQCFEIRDIRRGNSSRVEFYAVTASGEEDLSQGAMPVGHPPFEKIVLLLAMFGDKPVYMVEQSGLWNEKREELKPEESEVLGSNTLLRPSENPNVDGSTLLRPAKNSPQDETVLLIPAEITDLDTTTRQVQ